MNFEKLETLFAGTPAAGFAQIVIDENTLFPNQMQYILRIFIKDVSLIFTVPARGSRALNRDKFYTVISRVQERLNRFINEYNKKTGYFRTWITELSENEEYSWAYIGWKKVGSSGTFTFSDGDRALKIPNLEKGDFNCLCQELKVVIKLIEEAKVKIGASRQPFFNWYTEHPARFTSPVEYYDYLVERIKDDNQEVNNNFLPYRLDMAAPSLYLEGSRVPTVFLFWGDETAILIPTKACAPLDEKMVVYKYHGKVYIGINKPALTLDDNFEFKDPVPFEFHAADLVTMSAHFGGEVIFESFESSNVCAIDYSGPVKDKVSTVQEMGWIAP